MGVWLIQGGTDTRLARIKLDRISPAELFRSERSRVTVYGIISAIVSLILVRLQSFLL